MVELSEEQVTIIYDRLQEGGIRHVTLANELLDHYCCCIEEAMAQGLSFEEAYQIAYRQVSPDGVMEIEEERAFLLTFNKQITMKKLLYSAGLVAAFGISMGFMFRLMHWPGADKLLLTGFGALTFLVVPLMLMLAIRNQQLLSVYDKVRIYAGILAGLLIGTGSLFKMMNLTGGSIMFVLGMFLLNLFFLPIFFYHLYRKSVA